MLSGEKGGEVPIALQLVRVACLCCSVYVLGHSDQWRIVLLSGLPFAAPVRSLGGRLHGNISSVERLGILRPKLSQGITSQQRPTIQQVCRSAPCIWPDSTVVIPGRQDPAEVKPATRLLHVLTDLTDRAFDPSQ